MKIIGFIHAGHTAMAPVLSPDGRTLYLCNRFDNDVSVIDLASKKQICRVPVTREPVAAAITKDGKLLLIANHIPSGRADANYVAAVITVIDTGLNRAIKELQMPNGSGSLNDIRVSPDGLYAVVPHLVSRFNRLPTHLSEGWINANALTVIDIPEMRVHGTILLDDHYRGMANPWSAAWSPDGKMLVLTHAGTHEISVIDFSTLLAELSALPGAYDPVKAADVFTKSKAIYEQPDNLPFAGRSRVRVKLDNGDLGPRASVFVCQTVYVANYFSDTLTAIDLSGGITKAKSIPLGGKPAVDAVRKGELYFHDATICYDGWQSCASCHPGDGRVDGFNWDLLNDGEGNPKNTKSLLLATKTPPLMSMGGRADAKVAIRAGIQNILFASQPQEDIVNSIFAYLQALKPVPSPFLVHAQLSAQARRGMKVFAKSGCADCHVPGLYTDLRAHDVGTRASGDKPTDKFYTPTLIEVWRTAPYLHDGSAPTMRAVVITRNPRDLHGATSNLSGQEIDDLCAYLLSL
jgi:YVTN family beta-propeller protein